MSTLIAKFEEIGRRVWDNITDANKYGIIFGEETITDSILLELARFNNFHVRIIQTPKFQEAQQGTDWEWYIGSHRHGWIRYAIQAKKLHISKYDSLRHVVGKAPSKLLQHEVLRAFSTANHAVPLYTFYNYYPAATEKDHWNCHLPYEKNLLGWTFTPLTNVEEALSIKAGNTFENIHSFTSTLPVRCLFSCSYFRAIYELRPEDGAPKDFLGESYTKLQELPKAILTAADLGILDHFPDELYSPQVNIYPERIAIITLFQ